METAEMVTGVQTESGVRLPLLEGSRNFRDLGGYPTSDGRHVRWGRVYRSGSMAGLSEAGHANLRALGICAVCDLRSTGEQVSEPYDWCAPRPIPTPFVPSEVEGTLRA